MELTKKTTILFPPDLHDRLVQLARARGTSLGDLVRTAVRRQYGMASAEERLQAASMIAAMDLPVDDVDVMINQSVESAELPE